MQRIQDYVRLGYCSYVAGEVPLKKAQDLVRKFVQYYRVDLNQNARNRAKRKGEGVATFLMYRQKNAELIHWILLVSKGEHPAYKLERLRDAIDKQQRIKLTGYELVRLTREGAEKPSWTWQMTSENYQGWRDRIINTVRTGDVDKVEKMLQTLYATPGFSGSRKQVKKLAQLYKNEWVRSRGKEKRPSLQRMYYLNRQKSETESLYGLLGKNATSG